MATTPITHHSQVLPPPVNRGPFSSLSEQLLAVRQASLRASQSGYIDPRLLDLNTRYHERAAPAGAGEQVPSIGGFVVQPEFSQELITRVFSTGELLRRMTQFPITREHATGTKIPGFDEQSRADGSRFGGMHALFYNESDLAVATKAKYRLLELNLKKLIGLCYVTDELAQDAVALECAVSLAFTSEFVFQLERHAIFGNGAGQPLGILDPTNQALIVIPKVSGQATQTIVYENVSAMLSRFWGPGTPNALWLISQDILPQLLTMVIPAGTSGGSYYPAYVPAVAGEAWGRLLGIPCAISEYCSTLGTQGDIILVDATQIAFAQKTDIGMAVSIHVDFAVDQSVFRFTWRVDTQPAWHTTLLPANGSTAALSPFVVLAPR